MNKVSPVILSTSKSLGFGISKLPNIAKLKGISKLNHFRKRFFLNKGLKSPLRIIRLVLILLALFNISLSSIIVFSWSFSVLALHRLTNTKFSELARNCLLKLRVQTLLKYGHFMMLETFPNKVTPDIDFIDEAVVQCYNVPVVKILL